MDVMSRESIRVCGQQWHDILELTKFQWGTCCFTAR